MFVYNILTFCRYLLTLVLLKYGGSSASVLVFLSASLSLPITNLCFGSRALMGAFAESPKHAQYLCSLISFVGLLLYSYAEKHKLSQSKADEQMTEALLTPDDGPKADAATALIKDNTKRSDVGPGTGAGAGPSKSVLLGGEDGDTAAGAGDTAAADAAVDALAAAVGAADDADADADTASHEILTETDGTPLPATQSSQHRTVKKKVSPVAAGTTAGTALALQSPIT
jgi:hypothetical protein